MQEDRGLTNLIANIFDAALDSARWSDVLANIAGFVGGQAAALLSKNSAGNSIDVHYHCGVEPRYTQLYADTYWKFDPVTMLSFGEVDQVASISELVPGDEFRGGRFYQEWMRPQGFIDAAKAVLERTATSCACINIIRSEAQGTVDAEMRRRIRLIAPHLRRAVLIGKVIDLRRGEAATFADVLDGINASMFLVDADSMVVHANAAGRAMLAAGDLLRSSGGRLVAGGARVNQALREVFAAASSGSKGVAAALTTREGERYIAHVLPLTATEQRPGGTSCTAVAVLFVRKAEMEPPCPPELIARIYQLTPAELRVLLGIVEVGGVPEIAEVLGVAESTVKTHVGRLFEKTGANRQADLVRLVAGFSSPLVG